MSRKEDLNVKFVAIPDDFEFTAQEPFDRLEMIELFYTGYNLGLSPHRWDQEAPWVIE
ncbi:MAG: hypothetical protein GWN56_10725 [Nitrosopumilaceae archaeon]|nr:hypothetical protein [Nitrosopumilaceae archaeon]